MSPAMPYRSALLVVLSWAACGGFVTGGTPTSTQPPYMPTSPFWQPIGDNPSIDPGSPGYINDLLTRSSGQGQFSINLDTYTIAVFVAPPGTPRVDVPLTQGGVLAAVPIPPDAHPAPGGDGDMVILDFQGPPGGGPTSFEFYQAKDTAKGWQANDGVAFPLDGSGANPLGTGVRASSLSFLMGLITYDDIHNTGPITHALAWAFDFPNSKYFSPPATSSDGNTSGGRTTSIPEGARLQLDPALDLLTLGLSPNGLRLAQALQTYGLFCVDSSSDSSLIGQDLSGTSLSWQGLLSYDDLAAIPTASLRVLTLPAKTPIP